MRTWEWNLFIIVCWFCLKAVETHYIFDWHVLLPHQLPTTPVNWHWMLIHCSCKHLCKPLCCHPSNPLSIIKWIKMKQLLSFVKCSSSPGSESVFQWSWPPGQQHQPTWPSWSEVKRSPPSLYRDTKQPWHTHWDTTVQWVCAVLEPSQWA